MKGTLPDDPKESFDIAWAGGAVVNGVTNLIDVTKQVVIKSVQEDGTINTATSSRLRAKLEPSTKPATAPAAAPSTKRSESDEMNFLAGKEVTVGDVVGRCRAARRDQERAVRARRRAVARVERVRDDRHHQPRHRPAGNPGAGRDDRPRPPSAGDEEGRGRAAARRGRRQRRKAPRSAAGAGTRRSSGTSRSSTTTRSSARS